MSHRTASAFAAQIGARLGPGAVPHTEIAVRAEAAYGHGAANRVFTPDSADGIAAVLGMCTAEAWSVLPVGAGTWLPRLQPYAAVRAPILLSTARLDRVVEHEPADLVIGVEAGLPLERLAATLKAKAQWLPLDPAAAAGTTIGAVVARGDAGPLRAGHGTPRDMLLGVELATGDGRLLRFGGRVVKNVAGYDGVRLAAGSRGRIGVITRLYLRVRGAPRVDRTLAVACGPGADGRRRAADLALGLRAAFSADALEVLSPAVADALSGQQRGGTGWLVLVRMLGGEAAVAESQARAEQVARGVGGTAQVPALIWDALARLEGSATESVRLTLRPAELPAGLDAAAEAVGTDGWYIAAHGSDGIVRAWHTADGDAGQDSDGLSALAGSADWTVRYDRNGTGRSAPPIVADLQSRLIRAFDPAGVLNHEPGITDHGPEGK